MADSKARITVPWIDLRPQTRALRAELLPAIERVLDDASFALGPAVERFESDFAQYLGTQHCIGVNSGTTALQLALHAMGIGPGDEVITTPVSFVSTCWAIRYVGARPVFVTKPPRGHGGEGTARAAMSRSCGHASYPINSIDIDDMSGDDPRQTVGAGIF